MTKELNYYDYKKFANKRLHRIKEERLTQYAKYVEQNFGRLMEDYDEKLRSTSIHYGLNPNTLVIEKDVTYGEVGHKYFAHDDNKYISFNKEYIITDAGDYDPQLLQYMKVVSEDTDEEYQRRKEHIYSQREKRAIENLKLKDIDIEKYNAAEKRATDDFIRQLDDLRKSRKGN